MATISIPFTTTTATVFTVADSSCAALKAATATVNAQYRVLSCGHDTVSVGESVLYTTANARGVVYHSSVTAMVASPPATPPEVAALPLFQGAATSYTTGGSSGAITVTDAFGTATPEQYAALSLVFGAIITALAVIWGVKRVLRVFNNHSEA